MPIYEYRCEKCGHELEAMQKMADAPLSDCPECHEPALKKLISAAGFRLSGGGWYETDFKSDKEAKRNLVEERKEEDQKEAPKAAEASEAPKTEAKADAKIDSKAATMTPPKAKAKPRTGARARSKTKMARKGR